VGGAVLVKLFSCLDTTILASCPQRVQGLAVQDWASKNDGAITFYTSDDHNNGTVYAKLSEKPDVDGFIFYTLAQLDLTEFSSFLDDGYALLFAKEELIIKDRDDMAKMFALLFAHKETVAA
jgi:hypothetical protein